MKDQRSRNGGPMPVPIAVRFGIFLGTEIGKVGALRQGVPQIQHRGIKESSIFRETKMFCRASAREGVHDPNGRGSRTARVPENFLGQTRRYQGQHGQKNVAPSGGRGEIVD